MTWTLPALEKKLKDILVKHGQDVYLRRRCTVCIQLPPYGKYDDNCTICGGTGYWQTIERYTMRKMVVGVQAALTRSAEMTEVGVKLEEGTYFFCEANVYPKYGDLIYDWNNATLEWEVYELAKPLERRYDTRVLFYTCPGEIRKEILHT